MAQPQRPPPGWLQPLWVRVLFCIVPAVWAVFEYSNGSSGWALGFLAMAVWGVWSLIITFNKPQDGA